MSHSNRAVYMGWRTQAYGPLRTRRRPCRISSSSLQNGPRARCAHRNSADPARSSAAPRARQRSAQGSARMSASGNETGLIA